MSPDDAHRWLEQTAALRDACGCTTGAAFTVATLVLYPILWLLVLQGHHHPAWLVFLIGLLSAFAAGGLGKLCGILVARVHAWMRIRAVEARIHMVDRHG